MSEVQCTRKKLYCDVHDIIGVSLGLATRTTAANVQC